MQISVRNVLEQFIGDNLQNNDKKRKLIIKRVDNESLLKLNDIFIKIS